jgi:hypothetical protein
MSINPDNESFSGLLTHYPVMPEVTGQTPVTHRKPGFDLRYQNESNQTIRGTSHPR